MIRFYPVFGSTRKFRSREVVEAIQWWPDPAFGMWSPYRGYVLKEAGADAYGVEYRPEGAFVGALRITIGDWIVCRDGCVDDVMTTADMEADYEPVEEPR